MARFSAKWLADLLMGENLMKKKKKGGRAWALYAAEMCVKKNFLPIRNCNYKLSYVSLGIIKVQCMNLYR